MSEVVVTIQQFRTDFTEFSDTQKYTDALLNRMLRTAKAYVSTENFRVEPDTRVLLIELMMGHLITLYTADPSNIAGSMASAVGAEISASVGSVSVSRQAPIASDNFEQWIQTTGYGQQYWAILTAQNPTGVFYYGNPRVFGIR